MSTTKHANSTLPAATLSKLFGNLDGIARASGLIKRRSRKFSADGFLLTLFGAVCHGNASFQKMSMRLSEFQSSSLTKQSLHQRFDESSVTFLKAILESLLLQQSSTLLEAARFSRVLVQDSTQLWMNRKNCKHYRGVANNSGDQSAAKLDLIMDLKTGEFVDCQEVEAYTQDRTLGPRLLDEVGAGDLVIRDLGYFDVSAFQRVEELDADWISRLHGTADVVLNNGRKLEQLLESTHENYLDLEVEVTAGRHKTRLIAVRLPQEIADRRRQMKKDKRAKNKTSPKKGTLVREGWNLYLTSLTKEECSLQELIRFYEQRWQIEIQFRAFKQSTQLKRALNRITNQYHLQTLIYAAMIFATLSVSVSKAIGVATKNSQRLSIEKISSWLGQSITFLRSLNESLSFDLRHLSHGKRTRHTLKELSVNLLRLN